MRENGLANMQLRNVPTNSVTQVQPPLNVNYEGMRFSPDGNFFYFIRTDPGNDELAFLYRAPLLGGTPEKLAEDVDSNVTFSPDGTKVVFKRSDNPTPGEYRLIVKDLRSRAEKVLLSGPAKGGLGTPRWSPDGKTIVCNIYEPEGSLSGLEVVDAESGQHKPLLRSKDSVVGWPDWLPDGSGLLAAERTPSTNYQINQIVRVSYPDGKMSPVTRDTSDYIAKDVARSVPVVAAIVNENHLGVELMPAGEDAKFLAQADDFTWEGDRTLILEKNDRIFLIDRLTKATTPFGVDPGVSELDPSGCRDGHLVYDSYEPATQQISVWVKDADGQNRRKLTSGLRDYFPVCSPDSRMVYFEDTNPELLMRVPMDGGTPQKVSDLQLVGGSDHRPFDISPDGASALFVTINHVEGHKERLLEFALDTGQVRREIPMQKPHVGAIQYSPDGKAIEYVVRENGVDNIWRQPLDGSAGKWGTTFKSEHITVFQWSFDGKQLALVRGHTDSDVVLIRDTQN
jgi:eukaryotic-like serine/threonine-protein kinase